MAATCRNDTGQSSMRVRFLGCGDAFGSGGRFNTCFHVSGARASFLLDCGASSLVAMRRFDVDPNGIETILVSHLHGDHFGGLPFFLLDAQLVSRRSRKLTIAGPPGLAERLHRAREVMFPGSTGIALRFPLEIVELPAGTPTTIDAISITAYPVRHCSGAPSFALRVEAEECTIAYSGDTEWVDCLFEAARGADLFICEAYFYDKRVKYHLDYATLAGKLAEIGARHIILTHLSAELLGRRAELAVASAEDGMVVDLAPC
jgi:ribonuclease BN (tRNA processing enzyme)